jgi:hypothetical protein
MSDFYAYDNHHRDRARVHRSECPWCNQGRECREAPAEPMTNGLDRSAPLRRHAPQSEDRRAAAGAD